LIGLSFLPAHAQTQYQAGVAEFLPPSAIAEGDAYMSYSCGITGGA